MHSSSVLMPRSHYIKSLTATCCFTLVCLIPNFVSGQSILKSHCYDCHNDEDANGEFNLKFLGDGPDKENLDYWLDALDLVAAGEMPPEDDSDLSDADRKRLTVHLKSKVRSFQAGSITGLKPRRLNNREFANSVRDVLLLENVGTHFPTADMIGDSLHHGFDTHAETLGFSHFHLEQYVNAIRKILDATILSGRQPESKTYQIPATRIKGRFKFAGDDRRSHRDGVYNILNVRSKAYFRDFEFVPQTGRYKVTIQCRGKDRNVYDHKYTGMYENDPIQLKVTLGDEDRVFDLPDEEIVDVAIDEWLAAGTILELSHPTDGLRELRNGNFKFQYGIVPLHLKENDPERYEKYLKEIKARRDGRRRAPGHWVNWTKWWQGPRPQIISAEIAGPYYESWPPKRQVALIGADPKVADTEAILTPIAERAWRRPVREGELAMIVAMVNEKAKSLDHIEALKEGIVAILASPKFLLLNSPDTESKVRFASRLSYFLQSTIPSEELTRKAKEGKLDSFASVREEIQGQFIEGKAGVFLREFPFAWMELNDINFMAPDPDRFRFYHRKNVSEDMIAEVIHFFRYAIENNIPLPEFLSADYSFINADLATIYGVDEVPRDSKLRKYTFTDGRRGGLLGMAAFHTATADSLGTSPIHRAVYVMENFLGLQPTPPPPDVQASEPDVRQAKTIKEVLHAHMADKSCARCHKAIDPWGYAFENFDPTGAWRDDYAIPLPITPKDGEIVAPEKLWKDVNMPIDASAKFRNGFEYKDIVEFRKHILTDANRDRFVRCFIAKLLTYANGARPSQADFVPIDDILAKSAENKYRIVDTIAAVIDSPLFRAE